MEYILDFVILAVIYRVCFHKRWQRYEKMLLLIHQLFYTYVCMVLFVTLMPFCIPIPGVRGTNHLFLKSVNLIPFLDLIEHNGNTVQGIILNILMLIPFGFLFPIMKKYRIMKTVTTAFLFSLSIETVQLLYVWAGGQSARSFDITDLITNTFGAFVGYILSILFTHLSGKFLFP